MKAREQLLTKAEVDLSATKEALEKEKESLQEKEKALDEFIASQKQKTIEEAMLVEELHLTKELLSKAHKELQTKSDELNAELNKVKVSKVYEVKEVSNIKLEQNEAIMKEKKKEIPCKYFNTIKGCRFYHNHNYKAENKSKSSKYNTIKKFKEELNVDKETKQEQSENLMQVIIELLRLLIR